MARPVGGLGWRVPGNPGSVHRIFDWVTAANDDRLIVLKSGPGEAGGRPEVVVIAVDEVAAVWCAVTSARERVVSRIVIRHAVEALGGLREKVPAQSEIHRQVRVDLPIVLPEKRNFFV